MESQRWEKKNKNKSPSFGLQPRHGTWNCPKICMPLRSWCFKLMELFVGKLISKKICCSKHQVQASQKPKDVVQMSVCARSDLHSVPPMICSHQRQRTMKTRRPQLFELAELLLLRCEKCITWSLLSLLMCLLNITVSIIMHCVHAQLYT